MSRPKPVSQLRVSADGIKFIKRWEGLYLKAYYDPVGVLTIGYGHTNLSGVGPKVVPGMSLKNEDEADRILRDVLAKVYEPELRKRIKVNLTQGQWDALVSWIYNLGGSNFAKSTMLKRINAGRINDVPAEIMKWNKAGGRVFKGLTNRRRGEAAMWRSHGIAEALPVEGITKVEAVHEIDTPEPEPVGKTDQMIEKVGTIAPILTPLIAAVTDWKVAAVVGAMLLATLLYLYFKNRTEDS